MIFTRKCPCCQDDLTVLDFLKGSKKADNGVVCVQCNAHIIDRRSFAKANMFFALVTFLQIIKIKIISVVFPLLEIKTYAALIGVEFMVVVSEYILFLFHIVVSCISQKTAESNG